MEQTIAAAFVRIATTALRLPSFALAVAAVVLLLVPALRWEGDFDAVVVGFGSLALASQATLTGWCAWKRMPPPWLRIILYVLSYGMVLLAAAGAREDAAAMVVLLPAAAGILVARSCRSQVP